MLFSGNGAAKPRCIDTASRTTPAFEEASTTKHEFLNGEIYGMAGGTRAPAAPSVAVSSALVTQLRGGLFRVYSSDLRVRALATGLATYPDVTVVSGEMERDPDSPTTVVNPRLVVEILSDGTEAYDRGQKLDHYRRVPSLAAVVLVSHRTPAIEVLDRGTDRSWCRRKFGSGETAEIKALPASVVIDGSISGSVPSRRKSGLLLGSLIGVQASRRAPLPG